MRLRLAAVLALLMGAMLMSIAPAAGASPTTGAASGVPTSDDGQTIEVKGLLLNKSEGSNSPVEGVEITVTTEDGDEVTAISDDDGRYSAEIPFKPGVVTVELDEESLPDGVALREGSRSTIERTISSNLPVTITFVLGAGNREVSTWYDEIPQDIYNGFYFGIILALGALGLSMIYGTTGLTNFAHGELVTFGAIVTYMFNVTFGISIWISAILTLVLAAAFGYLQDTTFWGPLRKRGTGLIALMIVSIGLQFFLRNLFQFFTGGQTANYDEYTTPPGHDFGPITYTVRDLICMGIAIVFLLAVTVALSKTRVGRATRAIADNPKLAAATGINVDRIITLVWTVGTMLAGLCGLLLGFSQSVKFDLGAQVLLIMFAAITVGGLGSIWGAIIGSVLVGVLIELSTIFIPSELKIAAALFMLILILLVRPQGLLGRAERVG